MKSSFFSVVAKLIGLVFAGWVLLVGFAFFWPTPDLWFPGTREAIRHAASHDHSNEERLRHIVLGSRRFEMGREGGIVVGYGPTSWQQLKEKLTLTDMPDLLNLYKATPIELDDKLRIGILWAIAAQCSDGLSFVKQAIKEQAFDLGDGSDALSHIMILAQQNNAACPDELYNKAMEAQNKLESDWEAAHISPQSKQEKIK